MTQMIEYQRIKINRKCCAACPICRVSTDEIEAQLDPAFSQHLGQKKVV